MTVTISFSSRQEAAKAFTETFASLPCHGSLVSLWLECTQGAIRHFWDTHPHYASPGGNVDTTGISAKLARAFGLPLLAAPVVRHGLATALRMAARDPGMRGPLLSVATRYRGPRSSMQPTFVVEGGIAAPCYWVGGIWVPVRADDIAMLVTAGDIWRGAFAAALQLTRVTDDQLLALMPGSDLPNETHLWDMELLVQPGHPLLFHRGGQRANEESRCTWRVLGVEDTPQGASPLVFVHPTQAAQLGQMLQEASWGFNEIILDPGTPVLSRDQLKQWVALLTNGAARWFAATYNRVVPMWLALVPDGLELLSDGGQSLTSAGGLLDAIDVPAEALGALRYSPLAHMTQTLVHLGCERLWRLVVDFAPLWKSGEPFADVDFGHPGWLKALDAENTDAAWAAAVPLLEGHSILQATLEELIEAKRAGELAIQKAHWDTYNRALSQGYSEMAAIKVANNIASGNWVLVEGVPSPAEYWLHEAKEAPGMWAWCTPDKGPWRTTRTTPTKFLMRHLDLSNQEADEMLQELPVYRQYHWVTTSDAQRAVDLYTRYAPEGRGQEGPSPEGSCMRHYVEDFENLCDNDPHPVEIYFLHPESTIELWALVDHNDRTVARALVSCKNQAVARLYTASADAHTEFVAGCRAEGKKRGWNLHFKASDALNGEWLQLVRTFRNDEFAVMPYVDGGDHRIRWHRDAEAFTIDVNAPERGEGVLAAASTDGSIDLDGDRRRRCHYCEETTSYVTYNDQGVPYCESCYSDLFRHCARCSTEFRADDVNYENVDGESFCSHDCISHRHAQCERCSDWCSNDSIEDWGGRTYCPSCVDYVTADCADCEDTFHRDDLDQDILCRACARRARERAEDNDSDSGEYATMEQGGYQ